MCHEALIRSGGNGQASGIHWAVGPCGRWRVEMYARNGVIVIVLLGSWLVAGADELRPLGSKVSEDFGKRVEEVLSDQAAWPAHFITESPASWREAALRSLQSIEVGIETKLKAIGCNVVKSEEAGGFLFKETSTACGRNDIKAVKVVPHVVLSGWNEIHLETTGAKGNVLVPGPGVSVSVLENFYGIERYSPEEWASKIQDFEREVSTLSNADVKRLNESLANAYFEAALKADSYRAFYVDSLARILLGKAS